MIFYAVDVDEYSTSLKINGNTTFLKNIESRKVYELFIENLQQSYTLQIKDGHNDFAFSKEEITNIFLRARSATL